MEFLASIQFKDIFDEEIKDPEHYLKGIPSLTVISILSLMNSQLYNRGIIGASQINVFYGLLNFLDESNRLKINKRLLKSDILKNHDLHNNEIGFFSSDVIMDLMIITLRLGIAKNQERNIESHSRADIIINILKAYFLLGHK